MSEKQKVDYYKSMKSILFSAMKTSSLKQCNVVDVIDFCLEIRKIKTDNILDKFLQEIWDECKIFQYESSLFTEMGQYQDVLHYIKNLILKRNTKSEQRKNEIISLLKDMRERFNRICHQNEILLKFIAEFDVNNERRITVMGLKFVSEIFKTPNNIENNESIRIIVNILNEKFKISKTEKCNE